MLRSTTSHSRYSRLPLLVMAFAGLSTPACSMYKSSSTSAFPGPGALRQAVLANGVECTPDGAVTSENADYEWKKALGAFKERHHATSIDLPRADEICRFSTEVFRYNTATPLPETVLHTFTESIADLAKRENADAIVVPVINKFPRCEEQKSTISGSNGQTLGTISSGQYACDHSTLDGASFGLIVFGKDGNLLWEASSRWNQASEFSKLPERMHDALETSPVEFRQNTAR